MEDLNDLVVFARVAQTGSFTAAATMLAMPKSTVSRRISALEARLNARLLQRTTRRLSLTDAGETLFAYCARIVSEAEDAERAVATLGGSPRGVLRVTAPANAGFLAPIVRDYLKRYPDVRLEVFATTRSVDLVEERFDLAIRAGQLADSSLVARSLGEVEWFLVASPGYLRRRARPRSPHDLARHDCLLFGQGIDRASVQLEKDGVSETVRIAARLMVSDNDVLYAAALGGLGIAMLPAFFCARPLVEKQIERVLADWSAPRTPVHVLYPSGRQVVPALKSFVDHVQKSMTPSPWVMTRR